MSNICRAPYHGSGRNGNVHRVQYDSKPQVGDVVVSVEWPSGRVEYQSLEDYIAQHFYVHRTLFGWVVKLWWRSVKRRVRGLPKPGPRTIAEALEQK